MRLLILTLTILCVSFCRAQKNYEYTDTRKKNESFAKVPQKDIKADLAAFTLSGVDESIGKNDLKKISFKTFSPDSMMFEGETIKATITTAPFDPAHHKLDYDEKYLIKIDKRPYYGDYGSLPKSYIKNISLTIGKDTVAIPSQVYSDLYNLKLAYMDKGVQRTANGVYLSKDGHKIYLYIFCKNSTGSYETTWIIQDGKYLRRVLDYGFM